MKTYILDIIPKLFSFSKKLDNSTLISNKSWIVLDESSNSKIVYIFRNNGQLLLACNGLIEKGQWEYLNETTLIIDTKENSFLFKLGFFDNKVLALQLDGQEGFALLLNETFVDTEFKSSKDVEAYLTNTYFPPKPKEIPVMIPGKAPVNNPQQQKQIIPSVIIQKSHPIPVIEPLKFKYSQSIIKEGSAFYGHYKIFKITFEEGLSANYTYLENLNHYTYTSNKKEFKFDTEHECIKSLHEATIGLNKN